MDENQVSIKSKTRILLARNTPIALVVGAASFLGSNLVDKLLLKNIQVIGLDDLAFGKKDNLKKAIEDKNFHLIIEDAKKLHIDLDRLDYIFIASEKRIHLESILELFKNHKCRLLFISSVELYDQGRIPHELRWLKEAEVEIAKCAKDNGLNARILRLGTVFGPRMEFRRSDPIIELIIQSLTNNLQKDTSLEFSSRALYIDDATELAVKCIFAGATAQKIFDGVLPTPLPVSEIKQILLDPVWYENRHFKPTELPPWSTPNLEKTIKFLNWHPKGNLIEDLKNTLNYFKDQEIKVPELETGNWKLETGEKEWKEDKKEQLESLKQEEKIDTPKTKRNIKLPKFIFLYSKILQLMLLIFVLYALVWPVIQLGWGVLTFRFQLSQAIKNLEKGEFSASLENINQANAGISQAKSIFVSLEPLRSTGILKAQFEQGDDLSSIATLSADGAQNTILGIQALYQSLKAVTGEINDPAKDYFEKSKTYLASADFDLSKAYALLNDQNFKSKLPKILEWRLQSLSERLSLYSDLVKKGRTLSSLLPEVAAEGLSKTYLILLQNNNELRPTGGFIGSFAKVSFEDAKLKKLEVNDVYAIDGALKIHVEPPKEIVKDLGQKDWFLRDSNWEPDFPTSARQAEWFYNKETGERVEGVLALDLSSMEDLISVIGSLDLPDYNIKITSENLFQESISRSEQSFFPGTQAKKSFLTALTSGLLNKLFFLPNQNWPAIVGSLGKSLEQKHMSLYLDDPKLFSYLISQNWAALMPRAGKEKSGETLDFLAPVEANLGANKANYYLDRSYNLESMIGKDGEVSHRLRISYTNRSPSDTFPAGKYKNRMRIYLPFGSKLTKVLWGESDITKEAEGFVDYGRSAYSFLVELAPKEQKVLVLDYQIGQKLQFTYGKSSYKLDVIKQAGTLKDPFVWKISYPINYQLLSPKVGKIEPQEQTIQTDLSKDRSFEIVFQK